jgi:hypothetical protein
MKTFYDYLAESVKEYGFRIKTLEVIDDAFLDKLENALRKYDLIDISAPKRTIAQKNPLDFPQVDGFAEVHMVDVIVRIPASSAVMAQDIRNHIVIPDSRIVVRGKDEPVELENMSQKAAQDMAKEASDRGLEISAILNDPDYLEAVEGTVPYGDEYNQKFLAYLAQVAANREEFTSDGGAVKKTPRFAWLKDQPEADDFNAGIDGVKPAKAKAGKTPEAPEETLDSGKSFKKTYTKNGEKTVVSLTNKQVRKD